MVSGHTDGESSSDQERWLLTYADLITLLLVYFIVMFAMSQTDLAKFHMVATSVRRAFNVVDLDIFQGSRSSDGFFADFPAMNRDFVRLGSELTRLAQEAGLQGSLGINIRREGIVISIPTSVLFDSGSAQIRPPSQPTLDAIAGLLREIPNEVRIAGHTDDISPFPQWPSNWELSTARAVQVVKYLSVYGGLDPQRLSAVGYAEYQPLFPNDTPEHREANRRVDIQVVFDSSDRNLVGGIGDIVPPIEEQPAGEP